MLVLNRMCYPELDLCHVITSGTGDSDQSKRAEGGVTNRLVNPFCE